MRAARVWKDRAAAGRQRGVLRRVAGRALGAAASGDPARTADPLSARYLIAVAARIVREVGALLRGRRQVATFALDTEIRFAGTVARAAFADELTRAVTALVSKHHVAEGSPHRLVVAAHPISKEPQ